MITFRMAAGALLLLAATTVFAADQDAAAPQQGVPYLGHSEIASNLVLYSMSLLNSKYKFGGDKPTTGIDCSGFVRHVYAHVAGLRLPHNSLAMSERGETVRKGELKPGDLVFFKTIRQAISHVGIYLGDNMFIHAENSRKGVTISRLDNSYWRKHFDGARRLLRGHLHARHAAVEDLASTPYEGSLVPAALR
jgi:cell wall-associated NlpC family hydrolase